MVIYFCHARSAWKRWSSQPLLCGNLKENLLFSGFCYSFQWHICRKISYKQEKFSRSCFFSRKYILNQQMTKSNIDLNSTFVNLLFSFGCFCTKLSSQNEFLFLIVMSSTYFRKWIWNFLIFSTWYGSSNHTSNIVLKIDKLLCLFNQGFELKHFGHFLVRSLFYVMQGCRKVWNLGVPIVIRWA